MTTDTEPIRADKGRLHTPEEYLTGVHHGWHAVAREAVERYSALLPNGVRIAPAECGTLVRVSKHGTYVRDAIPVTYDPCPECAWHVAIATGEAAREQELALLAPASAEATALARTGLDPGAPAALCRVILERSEDWQDRATIRLLATVTRHRPGLAVSEECAEGSCEHEPCAFPRGRAVCWTCSLQSGDEAGEWAGTLMEHCTVPAPCGVLSALAAHHGLGEVAP